MSLRGNKMGRLWLKAHYLQLRGHRRAAQLLCKVLRICFQCDIPPECEIDESVSFCHGGFGCVVNPRCVIGPHCVIQHSVTIGRKEEGGKAPVICEGVSIGARAVLIGGIVIGPGAKVGAGAVVISDVPAGATVVGVPAHVVMDERVG